jgi:predicted SnoaL-like aldol condensation-catalyzing enzyme
MHRYALLLLFAALMIGCDKKDPAPDTTTTGSDTAATAAAGREEANKATLRRFYEEVFNAGDLAKVDEFIAADAVDHSAPPGMTDVRAGLKEWFGMWRAAFPDLRYNVEQMYADGDVVTAVYRSTGTFKNPVMGMAPTNKSYDVIGVDVIRFDANGKMVEHWGADDAIKMLNQLGITQVPSMGPPPGTAPGTQPGAPAAPGAAPADTTKATDTAK